MLNHHVWFQWCKVTKYIYSSTVLKYNFEVLILYWSISNCLILLLHYNYLKTLVTSYCSYINYYIIKHTLTTLYIL